MIFDDFLDKYNFVDFTDKHKSYLAGIIANLKIKDNPTCTGICVCEECMFGSSNNTKSFNCGSRGSAMDRFASSSRKKILFDMERILADLESDFWRL
ncbi:MAG: hypothetical protein ACRC0F_00115 [Cetobacterium sp.]